MVITDEHLIQRTLAGSQAAFGQLIARYQDFVFSLCMRVLGSREEAEETAQDAFLKVYHNLSTFKQESRFSTWLYTLTYRTALDRARLRKRPVQALETDEYVLQVEDKSTAAPDANLHQADLQDQLEHAINQLKPDAASVVSLYYLQEQSVKEIAEVTGLTETNVKTKLFRSREALRDLLRQSLQQEARQMI
ncbi:MAG: sigma-70 family RNA polymerase sigma factor [Lewinella sp.]|nr:sigma-70 family RNA polymerase sigma factor [Lewinella sp.]